MKTTESVAFFGLLAMAAIICPKAAHAKVGDTVQQTNEAFGKPIKEVEGGKVYLDKDVLIFACFDSSNTCQAVAYMKVNGQLSNAQVRAFDSINIPPHSADWTELVEYRVNGPKANIQYWSTPDLPLFVAGGTTQEGSLTMHLRAYMSLQGAFLMESVSKLLTDEGSSVGGQFTSPQHKVY
jgi:hypothetical protein